MEERALIEERWAFFDALKFAWADDQALRDCWQAASLAARSGFIDFVFRMDRGWPVFAEASFELQILVAVWMSNGPLIEAWGVAPYAVRTAFSRRVLLGTPAVRIPTKPPGYNGTMAPGIPE